MLKQIKKTMGHSRFFNDDCGSMTLDLMIMLPVMLVFFVGSFVYFDAFREQSRSAKVAFAVSDIMSRQYEVTEDYIGELYDLQQVMLPKAGNDSWMRISSIGYDDDEEEYYVNWSVVEGNDDEDPLEDEDIPTEALPDIESFDSLILTEANVSYTPMVDWVGISARTFTFNLANRPRYVSSISLID